ncbi:hypothetical protein [Burkholderia plantarii]|uniref:Uncharacterized protein n=1 Tax=Burkholderia plantarii TaxID=41899 RepID=A0A0B6RXH6_BURPL|nr:hypothetical protein [Burkholderia plantarii]AJK50077.1 hypothetical protein BGL_2c20130 [Burkholderia plantarii]GLZ20615.1 hypothetical protein Bpla01_41440 [Burkholderia plantarii]
MVFLFRQGSKILSQQLGNASRLSQSTAQLSALVQFQRRDISYATPAVRQHVDDLRSRVPEVHAIWSGIEAHEQLHPERPELHVELGNRNLYSPQGHSLTVKTSSPHPAGDLAHEGRHAYDANRGVLLGDSLIQGELDAVASQRRASDQASEPHHAILDWPERKVKLEYAKLYNFADLPVTRPGKSLT